MKGMYPGMPRDEFKKIVMEEAAKEKELELFKEKSRWENLKPFENIYDIPRLPVVEEKLWVSYYVPKLILAGAISKKDLFDGHYYEGAHRIARYARWDSEKNVFSYWREKFNSCFLDTCQHFEEYTKLAVFVPIKEIDREIFDASNKNQINDKNV